MISKRFKFIPLCVAPAVCKRILSDRSWNSSGCFIWKKTWLRLWKRWPAYFVIFKLWCREIAVEKERRTMCSWNFPHEKCEFIIKGRRRLKSLIFVGQRGVDEPPSPRSFPSILCVFPSFFIFFLFDFLFFLSHWWIYVILNWIYTRMTIGQTHCGLFLIFSLQALESTSHPVGFHLESTKGESDRKMTSILNLGRRRIRERTDESKGVKRAKKYEKKEKLDSNLYRGPTFIAQQLPLFLRSWAPNLVLKVNYS